MINFRDLEYGHKNLLYVLHLCNGYLKPKYCFVFHLQLIFYMLCTKKIKYDTERSEICGQQNVFHQFK